METTWEMCAKYLETYGYPKEILPQCNRYFGQWIRLVLGDNESYKWWQVLMAKQNEHLQMKIPCAMWLAGQLFNKRRELVQLIRKAEKPDVLAPGELPELRNRMVAALAWHQEERPKLERFINIPDIDERFTKVTEDLSFVQPAKRQAIPPQLVAFDCGVEAVKVDGAIFPLGYFLNGGVKYFATLQFLKTMEVTGTPTNLVSRDMTPAEIRFLESISDATRVAIFGTLVDWKQQPVFRAIDLQSFAGQNNAAFAAKVLRYLHQKN